MSWVIVLQCVTPPPLHGEDSKYSTLKFQQTRWSRFHEVVDVALDSPRVPGLVFRSSTLVSSRKSFEFFDVATLFVSFHSGTDSSHDRRRSLTRGRSFSPAVWDSRECLSNLTRCFFRDLTSVVRFLTSSRLNTSMFFSLIRSFNKHVCHISTSFYSIVRTGQREFLPSDIIHCYNRGKKACHEKLKRRWLCKRVEIFFCFWTIIWIFLWVCYPWRDNTKVG